MAKGGKHGAFPGLEGIVCGYFTSVRTHIQYSSLIAPSPLDKLSTKEVQFCKFRGNGDSLQTIYDTTCRHNTTSYSGLAVLAHVQHLTYNSRLVLQNMGLQFIPYVNIGKTNNRN